MKSPLPIRIKFQPRGGAQIDLESVVFTYVKDPAVDLTQRVKPFIREDGIVIDNAVVPAGSHIIRIEVKDTDGRLSTAEVLLKVRK